MDNTIKSETITVYRTSNRTHNTKKSAENEIIEQEIRDKMYAPYYSPKDIRLMFDFLFKNRDVIKNALNMKINYE